MHANNYISMFPGHTVYTDVICENNTQGRIRAVKKQRFVCNWS